MATAVGKDKRFEPIFEIWAILCRNSYDFFTFVI
jgi:hypothetical protein